MAGIQRIDDERSASALADVLNGDERTRPVVVVTIPSARDEPWIDVEEVARECGDLADVHLMPTNDASWAFSARMAEGTQVYGGAGRVYPVGHEWAADLSRSPLRFAFNADEGARATQQLISDALRMAAASGLAQARPASTQRPVEGTVKAIVAGRALVDIGAFMPATIAEELTVEDVAIDRLVTSGQRIAGLYDEDSTRIDVTGALRAPAEALAEYSLNDVVLARVVSVRSEGADLLLYPRTLEARVAVVVDSADVTTNPLDDLRELMTVGEVVAARITAAAPRWSLTLSDVDDDEPIRAAPALLPDGPPWLVQEAATLEEPEDAQPVAMPPIQAPTTAFETMEVAQSAPPLADDSDALRSRDRPRPSPTMFDPTRPQGSSSPTARSAPAPAPEPVAPAPAESTRALLLKIDGLKAEAARLERERVALAVQVQAATHEREQLQYLRDQEERRANRAEHELRAARARLRKASGAKSAPAAARPQFADAEQGFRFLVQGQWATRTPMSEQRERALPDLVIGPQFLESLSALEGVSDAKVADVVVEIVTERAQEIAGREVHMLRTGTGGADPARTREDGAVAWRASLQVNTPSARRIHYWRLPDGRIELARVAKHDDFDI